MPPCFALPPTDRLDLIALDADRNVRRRWSLALSQDLFGCWLIETRWGRVGTRGRRRVAAHNDRDAAEREVATLLRRRAGALGRIGVGYSVAD